MINLSEAATYEFTEQRNSQGFQHIQQDAIDGGQVGGRARKDLEEQGLTVVSEQNFLKYTKGKKRQVGSQLPLLLDNDDLRGMQQE